MEPECKTLFCTHCWLKIAVITKTFLLSESRWGKCTSPVAASPLALNVDMHNFSLTMMAWNDVLFQGWHERGCCLDWQVGALLSQASVRGAGWLWPRWRDVFFSAQWALWLDSVRSFHVDSSPLSSGSIVAPARAACLSSSPLIDQHACFSFPQSGKANWGTFDSPCFPKPPGALMGTLGPASFMGKCWPGEMGLFTSCCCLRRWLSGVSTFQKLLSRERRV